MGHCRSIRDCVRLGRSGYISPEAPPGFGHTEFLDVIDPRVAGQRRQLRTLRGHALIFDGLRGFLTCAELFEPVTGFDASNDGLVQRQAQRRRLRERGVHRGEDSNKTKIGRFMRFPLRLER
jgi:hypothetical protein